MVFVFIGPEGSGKGTQAELLAKKLTLPHIVTGDILRSRMNEKSPTGELITKVFAAGQYLTDEDMIPIYLDRIKEADCDDGFVSDGFPRSVGQAETLDKFLQDRRQHVDKVFLLDISEDETIRRLSKRGRFDDTPEKIKSRLGVYHSRADAMIAYYKQKQILHTIDAARPIETIAKEIEELAYEQKQRSE